MNISFLLYLFYSKQKREVKIKKLLLNSLLIFFSFLGLSSCASISKNIVPHQKAFALVKTIVEVQLYECEKGPKEEAKNCRYNSLGKRAAIGSGTFFSYKSKIAFLTAGHVCLGPAFEIWNSLPPGSRVVSELLLESYTGHKIKGKISYVNLKYDVCIVEANHPTVKRLPKISLYNPTLHNEHYSIAAPASIFDIGMVPVLQGLYVGDSKVFSFYTIPAAPGASGGAIYDSSNNIVGLVQRTHSHFSHVSLSIKHKDLNDILERYMSLQSQGIKSLIE